MLPEGDRLVGTVAVWLLVVLWLGAAVGLSQTDRTTNQPEQVEQNDSKAAQLDNSTGRPKSIEQEKKELKVMLITSIIVLSGFFLGVILVTVLRIGRRYRRGVQPGKKDQPTEYVDAWSHYRLKDENTQQLSQDD